MGLTLTWVDWAIMGSTIAFITAVAISTKKYTRSVADFLAANRLGGRYLLTVSNEMAGVGAISFIMNFELHYTSGFANLWWKLIQYPIVMVLFMLGYAVYRYRESRVMTLGQLYEIRYSKKFRIFAGVLGWLAGIINFGIFPAVGTRFFISFCGLPESFMFFGIQVSMFVSIMIFLLSISLFFTFVGGQIAVMVTDFLQGTIANVGAIILIAFVLWKFDWGVIGDTIINNAVEGKSMVNPFDTTKIEGFSIWFFMMAMFISLIYNPGQLSWQGSIGNNCSAKSAHEFRMAKILGLLRSNYTFMIAITLSIAAYVVMNNQGYSAIASEVNTTLDSITSDDTARSQMLVPIVLTNILPRGLIGIFCTIMLAAFISTHDTYLHSWGILFIQDVILPFRKKPFTPKQHMLLLRLSILFVAVFIFCFSMIFKQVEYIYMFFMITGAIYTGGIGAVIIGALYWKRGTTAGAWAAMLFGSIASVTGIILQQVWPYFTDGGNFPLNGMVLTFYISIACIVIYVVVSLLSRAEPFNIDRMLHRGKYTIKGEEKKIMPTGLGALGFSKQLPRGDKLTYLLVAIWVLGGLAVFVYFTIYQLTVGMSNEGWVRFWKYYIYVSFVMLVSVSVWFMIGGFKNLKELFRDLAKAKRNELDDGMVVDHHSAGEELLESETSTDQ